MLLLFKWVCKIEVVLAVIFIFPAKVCLSWYVYEFAVFVCACRRNTVYAFLGDKFVSHATRPYRTNTDCVFGWQCCRTCDELMSPVLSFYVFRWQNCRTGDKSCRTKTPFFSVVRRYAFVAHTFCVFGRQLYVSRPTVFWSHERNFCFFRRQLGFLGDKWNNIFVFCAVTCSCLTYKHSVFLDDKCCLPYDKFCRTYSVLFVIWHACVMKNIKNVLLLLFFPYYCNCCCCCCCLAMSLLLLLLLLLLLSLYFHLLWLQWVGHFRAALETCNLLHWCHEVQREWLYPPIVEENIISEHLFSPIISCAWWE